MPDVSLEEKQLKDEAERLKEEREESRKGMNNWNFKK